jgi:class 3 adenylate cyclase/tetratricopeptide (TPR) repeat protein
MPVHEGADVLRCPSCGAENPPQSSFCNSCGARLEPAPPPREERKLVSVLFVDLVGFTARSDRADPEDVREEQQLYHAEAKRRIGQYGGVVEKFIGDAVMAVFGAPTAHGDDAERAVRAGLSVLDGIGDLNRDHGLELAARAAVNTGDAVVALDSGHGDALATGDVVNTAARLQSAAPEGRLLVGLETHQATRHSVVYEPHGAVDAKGKDEAVQAWLAVRPRESTEPAGPETRLVGRSHEVELMRSVWDRCLTELRPHLVTVLGPPGIGKSRLCREFTAQVAADGGRILRGRCLPYEEQVGYQAFSRLVHAAADIFESDAPSVARDKLRFAVIQLVPEDEQDESFRHLALLLGLAPDDEVAEASLLYFAARRFIECVGARQPAVFVFEDIHWAQTSEIGLLEYLVKHLRDSPVMLVAAARPELLDTHPTWGAGLAAQTTIALDPLRAEDATKLAAQIVRPDDGRAVDLSRVVETAGGNPLFLEELAASIGEVEESGDLPVTVREAIAARIDALPPDARSTLLTAAVVGKTFWRTVLDELGDAGDLDNALAVLEVRDFVRRDPSSQLAGDVQFTFKHMLIREVAYSTLPRAVRRERHASVAHFVEEHLDAEALPTILAHHWREAGKPARAIPYLVAAADAARRSWAQETVDGLYSTAIELADDGAQSRDLQLQRGTALIELDEYERAVEVLTQVVPQLEGQQRLDALIALGHAYVWTERDTETLDTARAAAPLVDEVGDETAKAAVVAMESQALAMRGGEGDVDRSYELGERALDLWVPGTRPLDLAHHLHLHADTAYWVGEYERSLELSRAQRAQSAQLHSADSLLRGGGAEALALAGLGRHEEAIPIWDELFEIARELGHNHRVLLNYSSVAYRDLYDLEEARRRTEEALELSEGLSFSMPRQFAGSDLLLTHLLEGDIGAAQKLWPERWADADTATAWTTWLIVGRLTSTRAEIALHAETPETAIEWAQRAIEIARRTRRRKYEARSCMILGQALARLGRRNESLDALRTATAIGDELVSPPKRWESYAALGEAAYTLGDDDTAADSYAEAAHLIESFAATLSEARAAAFLAAPAVTEILSSAGRSTVS